MITEPDIVTYLRRQQARESLQHRIAGRALMVGLVIGAAIVALCLYLIP